MSKSLDTLGDAQLRRTLLFVRAQSGPVTARQVAAGLAIPVTVARWRLEKLVDAELVRAAFERRPAGRPAKTYAAAPQTEQIEFPPRHYEELVSLLLRHRPDGDLHEAGAQFGRALAQKARLRPGLGLEELSRALGSVGFHAASSEDGSTLVSAACPLRPIVVADPDARALDQGMWSALVGAATGAAAHCSTHGCRERGEPCRISVTLSR